MKESLISNICIRIMKFKQGNSLKRYHIFDQCCVTSAFHFRCRRASSYVINSPIIQARRICFREFNCRNEALLKIIYYY